MRAMDRAGARFIHMMDVVTSLSPPRARARPAPAGVTMPALPTGHRRPRRPGCARSQISPSPWCCLGFGARRRRALTATAGTAWTEWPTSQIASVAWERRGQRERGVRAHRAGAADGRHRASLTLQPSTARGTHADPIEVVILAAQPGRVAPSAAGQS
jgi:hypothetical protein